MLGAVACRILGKVEGYLIGVVVGCLLGKAKGCMMGAVIGCTLLDEVESCFLSAAVSFVRQCLGLCAR